MGMEDTCAYSLAAGEELEIGPTSSSMLKHIPHPGSAHARAHSTETASPTSVRQERNVGGEVVSHQRGASDLGRTKNPGHWISAALLLCPAVFIPPCT